MAVVMGVFVPGVFVTGLWGGAWGKIGIRLKGFVWRIWVGDKGGFFSRFGGNVERFDFF
jgi:hypothetical protein